MNYGQGEWFTYGFSPIIQSYGGDVINRETWTAGGTLNGAESVAAMRTEIAQLHGRLDATMIYVTHDQVEAMTLADKIVVLNGGHFEQVGTPIELYERPRSTFVAQFIGSSRMNLFTPADLTDTARNALPVLDVLLGIRTEHMQIVPQNEAKVSLRAAQSENLGEFRLVYLDTPSGQTVVAKIYSETPVEPGAELHFGASEKHLHFFDAVSEGRLT